MHLYPQKGVLGLLNREYIWNLHLAHMVLCLLLVFPISLSAFYQVLSYISAFSLSISCVELVLGHCIQFNLQYISTFTFNYVIAEYALFNYEFYSSILYIVHVHYIPSTDAYSTLHPFMLQVQILIIQIMRRLVLDVQLSNFSRESSYFENNTHVLTSSFNLVFHFSRVIWGHIPTTLVSKWLFQTQCQIQLSFEFDLPVVIILTVFYIYKLVLGIHHFHFIMVLIFHI